MGSEGGGAISVTVHVTGFKKFHGVSHNPTETIVSNLPQYLKQRSSNLFPSGFSLGSCTVLDAAGDEVVPFLNRIMESTLSQHHPQEQDSPNQVIWLHFGASGGLSKFAIEQQAVNEASFLFPDEHGWQPQHLPIVPEDGGTREKRQTTCPIKAIAMDLTKRGFDVAISNDAGRFVCNYVYYHSLRFAQQKGHKSLFVHFPLFSRIDEEKQMEFAASMLEVLALTN